MRAADRRFWIWRTKARRLVTAGLLVLVAVLAVAWARSTDTAQAASRNAQRDLQGKRHRRRRALSWAAVTRFARPRFKPTVTVDVHTAPQFWQAWSQLRPGERIDVHGVTFSSEAVFSKRLAGWAEIHFDSGTRFTGTPGSNMPAVWINRCQHVRFYGGDVTNPVGGSGLTIYDSSYVSWRNFVIHDTANTGLFVQGIHQPNTHLDLKGEIYHWGLNLALDPHSVKGTGLHGANLADSAYGITDSRFALDVHDGATGAGVEIGGDAASDSFSRNRLYLRCRNLTKVANRSQAGNCAQLWGKNITYNDFRFIAAQNVMGLPYETDAMYPGQSLGTDRVVYGRAVRTNLNPRVGPERWDRRFGTVFGNVMPRS